MGIIDRLRPSKTHDIAEVATRLEHAEQVDQLQTQVKESNSQLEMTKRAAEDLAWQLISYEQNDTPGDKELTIEVRQRRNKDTERMYREDALIRRAVNISNEYVFGRGFQKPSARDPRVQRVIDSFWNDPQNKRALTTLDAQLETNIDLETHGELFFVIFDQGKWTDLGIEVTNIEDDGTQGLDSQDFQTRISDNTVETSIAEALQELSSGEANFEYTEDLSGGRYQVEITGPLPDSAVKISKLHPNEITYIIQDTKSALIKRYYKRERVPYRFDYKTGQPMPIDKTGTKKEVTYYVDFDTPPPDDYDNAPPNLAVGKVMHRTINKGSHSLRGNSDVWVAVRWARLLNEYFEWRVTLLRALATFPFKRKVKGGMSQVMQAAMRMTNSQIPGNTGTPGDFNARGVPQPGAILTENESESLEQFKTTSGAGEATADILSLRAQAGMPLGLPPHYLGDVGSANLANATAMEFPVLKRFSTRQEFHEKIVESILDHAIKKAVDEGLIPEDADLTYKNDLPDIQERNIPELVNSINQIAARLDPFSINFKLKRFLLLYGLGIMGIHNPQKIVQDIYPPNAEQEEQQRMQQMGLGLGGAPATSSPEGTNGQATSQPEVPQSELDPLKNKKQRAQPAESAFDEPITPDELQAAKEAYFFYNVDENTTEEEIAAIPEGAFKDWAKAVRGMLASLQKMGVEEIERLS